MDSLERDFKSAVDRLIYAFIPTRSAYDKDAARDAITDMFQISMLQTVKHMTRFYPPDQPVDYPRDEARNNEEE